MWDRMCVVAMLNAQRSSQEHLKPQGTLGRRGGAANGRQNFLQSSLGVDDSGMRVEVGWGSSSSSSSHAVNVWVRALWTNFRFKRAVSSVSWISLVGVTRPRALGEAATIDSESSCSSFNKSPARIKSVNAGAIPVLFCLLKSGPCERLSSSDESSIIIGVRWCFMLSCVGLWLWCWW